MLDSAYYVGGVVLPGPSSVPSQNGQLASYNMNGTFAGWIAGGGAPPAGSGTELQYRIDNSTFGAIPNSSYDGTHLGLIQTKLRLGVTPVVNNSAILYIQKENNVADIQIHAEIHNTSPQISLFQYTDHVLAIGGVLAFFNGSGTQLAPGPVVNGRPLGALFFRSYRSATSDGRSVEIITYSDGGSSANSTPGKLVIKTTPVGAVLGVERFSIDSTGLVTCTGNIVAANLSGTNTGDQLTGGSGTELQVRSGATTFNPVTNSSYNGTVLHIDSLDVSSLTFTGTAQVINTTTVQVDDSLMSLSSGNVADTVDIGFYGKYNNGGVKYSGLFRDASNGEYSLFKDLQVEPTTTVDIGAAGFALADLNLGVISAITYDNLPVASSLLAGVISIDAQEFSGVKTFLSGIVASVNGVMLDSAGNSDHFLNGQGSYINLGLTTDGSTLTSSQDFEVNDEAYDATAWNANLTVPTKNAIRDKIESIPVVPGQFGITIDGGGSVISTGVKGSITIPYNMTILGWYITSDVAGSIVIDLWKDTIANYPPTVADTITGTEKPTLSTQDHNSDLTLLTWGTAVVAGDVVVFNVDSASIVTKVTLVIVGVRT